MSKICDTEIETAPEKFHAGSLQPGVLMKGAIPRKSFCHNNYMNGNKYPPASS